MLTEKTALTLRAQFIKAIQAGMFNAPSKPELRAAIVAAVKAKIPTVATLSDDELTQESEKQALHICIILIRQSYVALKVLNPTDEQISHALDEYGIEAKQPYIEGVSKYLKAIPARQINKIYQSLLRQFHAVSEAHCRFSSNRQEVIEPSFYQAVISPLAVALQLRSLPREGDRSSNLALIVNAFRTAAEQEQNPARKAAHHKAINTLLIAPILSEKYEQTDPIVASTLAAIVPTLKNSKLAEKFDKKYQQFEQQSIMAKQLDNDKLTVQFIEDTQGLTDITDIVERFTNFLALKLNLDNERPSLNDVHYAIDQAQKTGQPLFRAHIEPNNPQALTLRTNRVKALLLSAITPYSSEEIKRGVPSYYRLLNLPLTSKLCDINTLLLPEEELSRARITELTTLANNCQTTLLAQAQPYSVKDLLVEAANSDSSIKVIKDFIQDITAEETLRKFIASLRAKHKKQENELLYFLNPLLGLGIPYRELPFKLKLCDIRFNPPKQTTLARPSVPATTTPSSAVSMQPQAAPSPSQKLPTDKERKECTAVPLNNEALQESACFIFNLGPVAKGLLAALAVALVVGIAVSAFAGIAVGVATGAAVGAGTAIGTFFAHQRRHETAEVQTFPAAATG